MTKLSKRAETALDAATAMRAAASRICKGDGHTLLMAAMIVLGSHLKDMPPNLREVCPPSLLDLEELIAQCVAAMEIARQAKETENN